MSTAVATATETPRQGARATLAELKRRAEFSTVGVSVVGDGDSDGWSISDAADDDGTCSRTSSARA